MESLVAGTILATLLMTGVGSTQQPDTIRTAGAPISVQPIAHGTVVLLLRPARRSDRSRAVRARPAGAAPGGPAGDGEGLHREVWRPPKPSASSDQEPNPDLLVSALPVRPEQIARLRRLSPTVILVTHTHTDHLDPRAIAAVRTPQTRIIVPAAAKACCSMCRAPRRWPMASASRSKI